MGNITTVAARERLKPDREPHWHKLATGLYLGYRKMTAGSTGAWLTRAYDPETQKQHKRSLGELDHLAPSLRFDAARREAEMWFKHLGRGGKTEATTVQTCCENYVKHLRGAGKEASAKDAEMRFKRWVYGSKFAAMELTKLKASAVGEWRSTLASSPARLQDRAKEATKARSPSSLNRDMTSFRAALNLSLENGEATDDSAWRVKLRPIKNADGRRDIYLDPEQRRKLIGKAAPDLAIFLRGLNSVPLRPGAMAALRVGEFDKRLAALTIGQDKSGGDRKITLPTSIATFFTEQAGERPSDEPLLTRADGSSWNKDAWKGPIKEAAQAAELPSGTTAYALRHSTITDLIALHKLDTLTVAQLSGTSLAMIEKHYGHLLRDHAAQALALLAA